MTEGTHEELAHRGRNCRGAKPKNLHRQGVARQAETSARELWPSGAHPRWRYRLESLGDMLEKADVVDGRAAEKEQYDFTVLSDDELRALEALLAKARRKGAQ